jgi:ribosomal protein L25, Ctc-form
MSDSKSKLKLDRRELKGKKLAELRKNGLIPSVVYGGKSEPIMTQSGYNETDKAIRVVGYHSPIDLDVDNKKQLAMIKNVSFDPVKRTIVNIEFQAIKADEIITATTPIELVGLGESPAERAHLSILHIIDEVEVKAKPADLPEALRVSVEKLVTMDDDITMADIQLPDGVKFADPEIDMDQVIANVYDSAVAAAKAAEEDAAAAEATASEEAVEVPSDHGTEDSGEAGKTE